jgi:hypothetical protein
MVMDQQTDGQVRLLHQPDPQTDHGMERLYRIVNPRQRGTVNLHQYRTPNPRQHRIVHLQQRLRDLVHMEVGAVRWVVEVVLWEEAVEDADYYFLFNWHNRNTHISYCNIFAISFLKNTHIISLINKVIGRINECKRTGFYNQVPIIGYNNFIGFK